jgi:hypothetical protein
MSDLRILPHADSDLPIPRTTDIIARIADLRRDAVQQCDTERTRQLNNLATALTAGIRMAWVLGDLLVSSASTPGVIYTVSCGSCNCPARKPCKHLALAEVLLDLLDAQSGDADLEADCDEAESPLWSVGAVLGQRLAMARSCYIYL